MRKSWERRCAKAINRLADKFEKALKKLASSVDPGNKELADRIAKIGKSLDNIKKELIPAIEAGCEDLTEKNCTAR